MLKLLSIADFFSISNAILGTFSILLIITNLITVNNFDIRLHISLSLILLALIFDGLDGIIARRTWKSKIGEYLDSMADMISLVIAPSIFIYFIYSNEVSSNIYRQIYIFISLVLLVTFGIIRLASFHLMKREDIFIGLPAPANTIVLLMLSFIKVEFIFILPVIIMNGALMVSSVSYPKPGIRIDIITSIFIIFIIIFGKGYYMIVPILLLSGIIFYVIFGPIFVKFFLKNQ